MVSINANKRRNELKKIIEEIGLWNINKTQLAEKFGVTHGMISKDVKKIIKLIPKEKLEQVAPEFLMAYIKGMKEMRKILVQGDNKEKIMATKAVADLGDKFTKLLEDYGYKGKVVEEIKLQFINPYDDTLSGTQVARSVSQEQSKI